MGQAKNRMMEIEERGYGEIDTFVCSECVGDNFLKQFITNNGSTNKCCYCGESNTCINTEDLIGEIMKGILYENDYAVNNLGRVDGDYYGHTYDTSEMLEDYQDEFELNEQLFEDVVQTIHHDVWCKKNPYGMSKAEAMQYSWEDFCTTVKYFARYVFFRKEDERKYEGDEISPNEILDYIAEYVSELELVTTVKKQTVFYRGITHEFKNTTEFGSPPIEFAKSNRMSAEGISVFYGAADAETVKLEVGEKLKAIAQFKNVNELYCLDLTKISGIQFPSLFDYKKRHLRGILSFYRGLEKDITKPIEDMKEIEYVPIQIIAEYFRHVYRYKNVKINGIKYGSAKSKDGVCYVLFCDKLQCTDDEEKETWQKKQELKLVENSVSLIEKKIP
jgi:hypothetical protein